MCDGFQIQTHRRLVLLQQYIQVHQYEVRSLTFFSSLGLVNSGNVCVDAVLEFFAEVGELGL